MKGRIKTILAPVIVLATIAVFVYYLRAHPETLQQLRQLAPSTLVVLLVLQAAAFLSYVYITRVSLRIYQKTMSWQENGLFNAYSSLINFFGPGQSGPIFRAAYLKKRHNVTIKQFALVLMIYLAFYAVISALFMVVGSRPWWQTALVVLATSGVSWAAFRLYERRSKVRVEGGLPPRLIVLLFAATALQVTLFAVVYGFELASVGADASLGTVLSYTGVSNMSLFVALTPGAIGIREAFLVFSQNLHGIDTSNIIAANILDRAVYLVFLGLLFILVLATHAKDKLRVSQLTTNTKP